MFYIPTFLNANICLVLLGVILDIGLLCIKNLSGKRANVE